MTQCISPYKTIVGPRFEGNVDYVRRALNSQKFDVVIVIRSTALIDSGLLRKGILNPQAEIISQNEAH